MVVAGVNIEAGDLLELFKQPVFNTVDLEITMDNGVEFEFAQFEENRNPFQPRRGQAISAAIAS